MKVELMRSIFNFRLSIFDCRAGRWLGAAIAAAMASPSDAAAQGCAMCYQSASAVKSAGLEALQSGILILLVPPLLIFGVILWGSFHRREGEEADGLDLRGNKGFSPQAYEFDSQQEN